MKAKKCRELVRPEEVEKIVKFHRSLFDSTAVIRSNPTKRKLDPKIATLKKAQHLLESMQYVLALNMPHRNLIYPGALVLLQAAEKYLSGLARSKKRETLGGPGSCACKLADLFKERTGNCHWEEIGEALMKGFPELLRPKKNGDVPEPRLWALKLAQRHRRAHKKTDWLAPLILGLIESDYRRLQGEKTSVERRSEKTEARVDAAMIKLKQASGSNESVKDITKRYAMASLEKYF